MAMASCWAPSFATATSDYRLPLTTKAARFHGRAEQRFRVSGKPSIRIQTLSEFGSCKGSLHASTKSKCDGRSCLGPGDNTASTSGGVSVLEGFDNRSVIFEQSSLVPDSATVNSASLVENGVLREDTSGQKENNRKFTTSTSSVHDGVHREETSGPKVKSEELTTRSATNDTGKVGNENSQEKLIPAAVKSGNRWSMLLSRTALDDAHLSRASSVTDAHVLRRKGRLKEQDGLIEFIISMHTTHSPFQVMEKMEKWVQEHVADPKRSILSRLVPELDRFHTTLPLVQALQEYDEFASLSRRKFVPPNFAEIRHVLNIAQVHAIAKDIALLTFDADGTLYTDGHHIKRDSKMIDYIIRLLQEGVHVAIVTAAGYPGDAARYEGRFAGLLAAFKELDLPQNITQLFHVVGGECNYLLRVKNDYHLEFVPDEQWQTPDMQGWTEGNVKKLLDEAETALVSAASRLRLPVQLIRKPRAVGVVPKEPTIYEVLEEMALTVQVQLLGSKLPFCAFNGGNDVFVDVGNKSVGLEALMNYLKKSPKETLHVGDRFTVSGNDSATRSQCSVLWVANPKETGFFIRVLLREVKLARRAGSLI